MARYFLNTAILFSLAALMVFGCKKGDEDPYFSFRTRTKRLTGDWNVTKYQETIRDTSRVLESGEMTESHPLRNDRVHDVEISMIFESTGVYEITRVHDYPEDYEEPGDNAYVLTEKELGTWQFTGGSGDSKENSQLLLLPSEVSSTRSDQGSNINLVKTSPPNQGYVYDMIKLSAKEMKLSYMITVSTALDEYEHSEEIELTKAD